MNVWRAHVDMHRPEAPSEAIGPLYSTVCYCKLVSMSVGCCCYILSHGASHAMPRSQGQGLKVTPSQGVTAQCLGLSKLQVASC